jgi:uncharacterized protein
MVIWAWLGALAIGLTLGLLGSGGSILTVPVLVYLVGVSEKVAIAESLAIVGAIAAVGALPYALQRSIHWRSAVLFGIPGIAGTYLGAVLSAFVSGPVQLTLFAVVMLLAAGLMFRGQKPAPDDDVRAPHPAWKVVAEGLGVGVLTGLVGVGGGFLIVPALVLLGGLPMRLAVGTSLLIIAAKSFAGFAKYLDVLAAEGLAVDWGLIAVFAAIGIVGSLVGNRVSARVPQAALKRGFAVFLLVMGGFILVREGPGAFGLGTPLPEETSAVRPTAYPSPLPYPSSQPDTPMSFLSRLTGRSGAAPSRLPERDFVAQRQPGDVVLDVRTPGEFAGGHLRGAQNVDVLAADFRQRVQGLHLPPDQPVYLYCRSGNRSGQAATILREMGFEKAVNVGAFDALRTAGADVE